MALTCPKCGDPFSPETPGTEATSVEVSCGSCSADISALTFPAVARRSPAVAGPDTPGAGAMCFFCEGRSATTFCESCGRLICERCEIDWAGQTTCLTCVHANREVRDADSYRSRRVLYDNLALSLLLWPLIVPVYGLFGMALTAPIALFLVIRHRKASRGIVPRGRFRLFAAGAIATLALAGMVLGFVMLATL